MSTDLERLRNNQGGRMRSIITASMAAALSACATSGPDTSLSRPATDMEVNVTYADAADVRGVTIRREALVARAVLDGTRRQVFNAIPDAFADVGLPLPLMDQGRWTGAVQEHRAMGRLGRDRLSRFLECGMGATGPNADTRRIQLSVYVLVQPTRGDSETPVQIRVDAVAHSTEGTAATPMTCSSQGVLEQAIANALQLRAIGG
jgi:hypothetical protein